jgi:predicted ATPase/class 3 adenylate cyclase
VETVVLLFTDVEGSTRAWASNSGMVRSLERHDAMLRGAFDAHRGVEFKHTGDGLCATFPSVSDAVLAAIDAQQALATAEWGDGPALRVRVAVHAGPAHRRGDDWFGLSLSRCARLLGAAHGGQVLLTNTAAAMLRDGPVETELGDLGRVGLRDFPEPEQVWQVLAPGLDRDFPPLRAAAAAGNLPADLSRIVGRGAVIERVRGAVTDARLVTLTGAGGVGKTRLAVAVAQGLTGTYTDGAWLVELASAQASHEVDLLVASALSLRPDTLVRESIVGGVGHRRMLVVLDNCEHVLDGVGSLAVALLRGCDQLAILATSREPLGVEGELTIAVPSLDIDTEAVELFVARAAAADAGFEVEDEGVIREICRRLDGIPLAIELAAAAARTLSPLDIAARLSDHLDVVTGGRRGRIERHATVRAAIDWSWSLLTGAERLAFARLSVFAGRFDLDAAVAVIGDDALGVDAFDALSALVDKSMLFVDQRGISPFRLLEPLRQYAAEKLADQEDATEIARRHAEHYAAVAARLALQLETSDEMRAAIAFGSARDNLRAAFAFAFTQVDTDLCLRIVTALGSYSSSYVWAEPWSWADTALAMPGAGTHPLRQRALLVASRGAWQRRDQVRALALADEALGLVSEGEEGWREAQISRANPLVLLDRTEESIVAAAAAVGDPSDFGSLAALRRLATLLLLRNLTHGPDIDAALDLLAHAKTSNVTMHATALHVVGVMVASTDRRAAVEYQRAAVDLLDAIGSNLMHGMALHALATAEARDDPAEGVRRYADMLSLYLRVGNRTHLREFARGSVIPLVDCQQWEAAAIVEGATRASGHFLPTLGQLLRRAVSRARDMIGEEFDAAADRGAAMTDEELVAYVCTVAARL